MSEHVPAQAEAHAGWDGTTSAMPIHPHVHELPLKRGSRYPHRSWRRRYGLAILLLGAAFCLRFVVYSELNTRIPFGFFTPAALIAAWFGGIGPGFFVVVSGLLIGDIFFLPPHDALAPVPPLQQLAIGLYAASSAIGVGLIEHLHITIRRKERQLREALAAPRDRGVAGADEAPAADEIE